jgi:hypothetical protein
MRTSKLSVLRTGQSLIRRIWRHVREPRFADADRGLQQDESHHEVNEYGRREPGHTDAEDDHHGHGDQQQHAERSLPTRHRTTRISRITERVEIGSALRARHAAIAGATTVASTCDC